MADFFIVIGGVSSAITIYDKKNSINSLLKKILKALTFKRKNIIIFGAGGTGKTTLSKVLTDVEIVDHQYNETANVETMDIGGDVYGKYIVAPGQKRRVDKYWRGLFRNINKGKVSGVINVVSYGYHSIRLDSKSYTDTKYYESESKVEFVEKYTYLNRKEEIEYLKTISESIKNTEKSFWIITLVNKQDLWWDKRADVEAFYKEGEYDNIIQTILDAKGKNNFTHEYISCSLTPCNFKIGNDLEIKTVSGYDLPLRQSNYSNFVNLLKSLINE